MDLANGNIFQPQVAQVNSATTPQEGVVDTTAVDLFADVAQVATEAGFALTGQEELSDLKGKFDKIVQARQQGVSSSALQVRARADLDEAKANAPWIGKQADRLFRDTFGGGSSTTGVFAATPEEKARDKHLQRVEETRLALGLSTAEEAQKRITLDENAASAKVQADAQKDVREYNGEVVFSNTQAQVNNQSIKFMDAVNRRMTETGGTLSNDDVRSLISAVDRKEVELRQQLTSQTRDQESGHLLIDRAGFQENIKAIEDWVANTKAMIKDNAYLKVIQDLNTEQNAEINFVATEKYRTLKELEAAGGQAAVQAYLVAAQRKEGPAKQLLIGVNPIAADMFNQPGSFKQAGSLGVDKLVLPTPTSSIMSEPEAVATGTELNDPANGKLVTTITDKVATESSSAESFESMVNKNPDSSAIVWSDRFKAWSAANPDKGKKVGDITIQGLRKSFLSAFVSDTGQLPSDISFSDEPETDTVRIKGRQVEKPRRGKGSVRRNVVVGTGITRESGKIAFNIFSVFKNNPQYLKQFGTENGNANMSAEEATQFVILGAPEEPVEATTDVSDTSGLGAGENTAQDDTGTPTEVFDALTDSSPEEIAKFQQALRKAKTSTEKAEVHAAFIDGAFRIAKDE